MTAADALEAARRAGVGVRIESDGLTLEAAAPPPTEIMEQLASHKAAIIALLRPGPDGWSAEDWIAFFDERAGIAEFDGGMSRRDAEAHAFACCVVEWLNRNPARSMPDRCLGCGQTELAQDPLLPFGTEYIGHAWLHTHCWPAWRSRREAEAVAILATMGILRPTEFSENFGKNEG